MFQSNSLTVMCFALIMCFFHHLIACYLKKYQVSLFTPIVSIKKTEIKLMTLFIFTPNMVWRHSKKFFEKIVQHTDFTLNVVPFKAA